MLPKNPVMKTAPIPSDDEARLQALRELLVLDTPPEERFDRVVRFAAEEFEVPIALISLLDRDRQWFKSSLGLNVCETARDISFCGHAILSPEPLVVEDALQDERFFDNPFVTDDPHIRFYAGSPLILPSGHSVGTLCLIDDKPRKLDRMDLAILNSLRDLVVGELMGELFGELDAKAPA